MRFLSQQHENANQFVNFSHMTYGALLEPGQQVKHPKCTCLMGGQWTLTQPLKWCVGATNK